MPINPSITLGPYQVTSLRQTAPARQAAKIGEGGMGEVYRGRDTAGKT
jgi:hypothetical protein